MSLNSSAASPKSLIPLDDAHQEEHFEDDMHAWAVSYADMLMVLLSFFVIFFSVSQDDRKQVIQMITKDFVQGKGPRDGTGEGKGEGEALPAAAPVPAATLQKVLSEFQTQVVEDSDQLIINFNDNLYNSGQVRLPPEASEQLAHLVDKLEPFMDRIELTFIGHSDSAPIASNRKQFLLKNNFDLSVLRASNAVDFAIQAGVPADHLSAKGYAATRRNSRTLSIVIEPFEPRTGVIIPEKSGPIQPSGAFIPGSPSEPQTGFFPNSGAPAERTPSRPYSAPPTSYERAPSQVVPSPTTPSSQGATPPTTAPRRFDFQTPARPPSNVPRAVSPGGSASGATPGERRYEPRTYERAPGSLPGVPGSRPGMPPRRENFKMPDETNPEENWRYNAPPEQIYDQEIGDTAKLDDPRLLAPSLGIPKLSGQYSLQVGAFGSEENAARFAEAHPELSNQIYYVPEVRGDDLLYKVYVGLFGSETEAKTAGEGLSELKLQGNLVRPIRVTSEMYDANTRN